MKTLPEKWQAIFDERKDAIALRLEDFAAVRAEEYFYELLFCILTPQSSARNAESVILELKRDRFLENGFDPVPYLRDPRHYIRFHNVKSKRLLHIREIYPNLHELVIRDKENIRQLREIVLEMIPGLGLKESSHFLRNIGVRGLAILDRHILKHLKELRIIGRIPKSLTPKRYLEIERKWLKYAEEVGITMDELDLLFWSMETGEIRK
ncbi:MAG: DNA lyase [Bacteroidota bacterium]|nr:DNA lyase [Bacteroidota bacterium]MDP4230265.1 DNA lyase [Bacteroidota bacterium]MDP4236111.1 DNA lyase [Bacteroidota bacterium]